MDYSLNEDTNETNKNTKIKVIQIGEGIAWIKDCKEIKRILI